MRLVYVMPVLGLLLLYALFVARDMGGPDSLSRAQGGVQPAHVISGREPILPLPPAPALPQDKVGLGERLFHDPHLSHDNSIACASCHALNKGGTDQSRFSTGINGAKGDVNAPTVFNSALNVAQFWDGRAGSLEEQAAGPVHNPVEMGSNWDEVIAKLRSDREYPMLFARIYQDGISPGNIVDAIATFERSLATPNARFDRYLRGEKEALSGDELDGYRHFVDYGCASCHQGAAVGGNMFQRFGVMDDFFKDRITTKADQGRFNVTGLEDDRHVFKVPSLRNVAVTYPYFHDGSASTLSEAVRTMGRYQLGRDLSEQDVRVIVAFLKTLSGEWQGKVLQ